MLAYRSVSLDVVVSDPLAKFSVYALHFLKNVVCFASVVAHGNVWPNLSTNGASHIVLGSAKHAIIMYRVSAREP